MPIRVGPREPGRRRSGGRECETFFQQLLLRGGPEKRSVVADPVVILVHLGALCPRILVGFQVRDSLKEDLAQDLSERRK